MPPINFLPDLWDLGHTHVVWSPELGAAVQDPAFVGQGNVYGPADVFTDASGANVYRVGSGGSVTALPSATVPSQQAAQPNGNQVRSPVGPSNRVFGNPGAQTGAAAAGAVGGAAGTLGAPLNVGQFVLPLWAWLAGLGGGAYLLTRRRGRR